MSVTQEFRVCRPLLAVVCHPKMWHKTFATLEPGMHAIIRGMPDPTGMIRVRVDEDDFLVFQADLEARAIPVAWPDTPFVSRLAAVPSVSQ